MTTFTITDATGRSLTFEADTVSEARAIIGDWRGPVPKFSARIVDSTGAPHRSPRDTADIGRLEFTLSNTPDDLESLLRGVHQTRPPASKRWQGPPPRSAR